MMLVLSATGAPVALVNRFSWAMISSSVASGQLCEKLVGFDRGWQAYPRQADPRVTLQKLPRLKRGSARSIFVARRSSLNVFS
jgi:hypothetical protein